MITDPESPMSGMETWNGVMKRGYYALHDDLDNSVLLWRWRIPRLMLAGDFARTVNRPWARRVVISWSRELSCGGTPFADGSVSHQLG